MNDTIRGFFLSFCMVLGISSLVIYPAHGIYWAIPASLALIYVYLKDAFGWRFR